MDAREEALERTVERMALELGVSSPRARRELDLSVRENPDAYVTAAPEVALMSLARALETAEARRSRDDYLDDDQYRLAFMGRMGFIVGACEQVLDLDPACLDAKLLLAIATPQPLDRRIRAIREALEVDAALGEGANDVSPAYAELLRRPRLRALAALARWNIIGARPQQAVAAALELMRLSKREHDPLGGRYTLAIAFARLEDEDGFREIERAWGHRDSAWSAIARTLLLFKLDRMPAARRALQSFISVYESGAFGLARPTLVEPYLPDRPSFEPKSLDEVVLAVHEAEPVIVDTPDFIGWCEEQPGFRESVERFARRMGYDDEI